MMMKLNTGKEGNQKKRDRKVRLNPKLTLYSAHIRRTGGRNYHQVKRRRIKRSFEYCTD